MIGQITNLSGPLLLTTESKPIETQEKISGKDITVSNAAAATHHRPTKSLRAHRRLKFQPHVS